MNNPIRILASHATSIALLFALAFLGLVADHVAVDRGAKFLPGHFPEEQWEMIAAGRPGDVHGLIWLRNLLQALLAANLAALILAGRESWRRTYHFIGSLRMAVPLILLIALCLIRGTLWEAREGNEAAQLHVYRTGWFTAVLAFLVANLVVSVLRRRPWRPHHVGFITVHTGIILMLAAGQIKVWWGKDGVVALWEGQTSTFVDQEQEVLSVARAGTDGDARSFPIDLSGPAADRLKGRTFELPVPGGPPAAVRIDEVLPHARHILRVDDDGAAANPALQVEVLFQGQVQHRTWLVARDPERHHEVVNGLLFLGFNEVQDPERLRQMLSPTAEVTSNSKGVLTLRIGEGADAPSLRLPVEEGVGKAVPIPGTSWTAEILRYIRNFQFDLARTGEERYRDVAEGGPNPALRVRIHGAEGEADYLIYAHHPDMNPHRLSGSETIPLSVTYEGFEGQGMRPPKTSAILFFRGPDGGLHHLVTTRKGETSSGALEIGKEYPYVGMPAGNLAFRAVRFVPNARVSDEYEPADPKDKAALPAFRVTASRGGTRSSSWLPWGSRVEFPLSGERVVVQYTRSRTPLPFEIRLIDFRKVDYPGTNSPAAFESDVQVVDPVDRTELKTMIYMNNPLRHRGWTLYQSSYEIGEDGRERSVFSAAYDPSSWLFYAGCIVFTGGTLMIFYLRPYLMRKDKERALAAARGVVDGAP